MMHNEGFGKKWIDRILGKVDKDQGVANAGKVLGIGDDGQVVPVEQSGGGSSEQPFEKVTVASQSAPIYYNHNIVTASALEKTPVIIVSNFYVYKPSVTVNSVDEANSIVHVNISNGTSGIGKGCVMFNGNMGSYDSTNHIVSLSTNAMIPISTTTDITMNNENAYFQINDTFRCYLNKSTGIPNVAYMVYEKSNYVIKRASDKKYFKVIIDNMQPYGIGLQSSADILYILAPPNVLSSAPFPDA